MKNEKPIIFSGPTIQAILDGRKTQTRSIVKVPGGGRKKCLPAGPHQEEIDGDLYQLTSCGNYELLEDFYHPYGYPGDRLWVKETWYHGHRNTWDAPKTLDPHDPEMAAYYKAGWDRVAPRPWKSPLYMPRWASRITLEVLSVRVDRLQAITGEDAIAEGCYGVNIGPRKEFSFLWNSLDGKKPGCSWADNPWVWVINFRKVETDER